MCELAELRTPFLSCGEGGDVSCAVCDAVAIAIAILLCLCCYYVQYCAHSQHKISKIEETKKNITQTFFLLLPLLNIALKVMNIDL